MKLTDILKGSDYSLELFTNESIASLEAKISEKANKRVALTHMSSVSFETKI